MISWYSPYVNGISTQSQAMIPLTRSAFYGPMAVAIMGGLVVATLLTLLFLPALYAAWFRVPREKALNPEGQEKREGLAKLAA